MRVTNPTDEKIFIIVGGVRYEVEGKGTLSDVKPQVAKHWKGVHEFIKISEDVDVQEPVKQEEKEEDSKEEVEKPKATKKTTKK